MDPPHHRARPHRLHPARHPRTEAAQVRSSVLGHTSAAACGLACLAALGLWDHRSTAADQSDNWRQIRAQALAVGLTLFLPVVLTRASESAPGDKN